MVAFEENKAKFVSVVDSIDRAWSYCSGHSNFEGSFVGENSVRGFVDRFDAKIGMVGYLACFDAKRNY